MKAGHLVPKAADVQSDQISANVIRQGDNREFKSTVMTLSKAYDFLSICGLESGAANCASARSCEQARPKSRISWCRH